MIFGSTSFPSPSKSNSSVGTDTTFDGVTFTAKKARNFELGAYSDTVTPSYRENLSGKNLFEFCLKAVEPLEPPFSLSWASINVSKDSDFFKNNNKVTTMLYTLKSRLTSYCMQSVFDILPIDLSTQVLGDQGTAMKLLDHACILPEVLIRASNKLYAANAAEKLHLQNLVWSQELLLASCDPTLRTDLEHRLVTIPDSEQGGRLVLHMILNQLMSTTHEAACVIVNCLQCHSVTDYPGENINNFCATFNHAVTRLYVSGHVPSEIANIFFLRLGTCTVSKFTGMLDSFKHCNHPIMNDFFALRDRAISKYNALLLTEKWLCATKRPSLFSTQQTKPAASDSNKDSTTVADTQRTTQDSMKRENYPIDSTPPAAGEDNWKENPRNPRRKLWWCAECPNGKPNSKGRWGNHSTNRHDPTKVNRNKPQETSAPVANVATTSDSGKDSTTTTTASLSLVSTATSDF